MSTRFRIGQAYTRDQIRAVVGGGRRICLPTKDGVVVAACLLRSLNPRAPHEILCGVGPQSGAAGALLASQCTAIPVFIKAAVNHWRYEGRFAVVGAFTAGRDYERAIAASSRSKSSVSRVVELRAVDD